MPVDESGRSRSHVAWAAGVAAAILAFAGEPSAAAVIPAAPAASVASLGANPAWPDLTMDMSDAVADTGIADFSADTTGSGGGDPGWTAVSGADFLSTELNGALVDYAAIRLMRSLRADHVLLKRRSDRAVGTSVLLDAAVSLLSSEIVSEQHPR